MTDEIYRMRCVECGEEWSVSYRENTRVTVSRDGPHTPRSKAVRMQRHTGTTCMRDTCDCERFGIRQTQ